MSTMAHTISAVLFFSQKRSKGVGMNSAAIGKSVLAAVLAAGGLVVATSSPAVAYQRAWSTWTWHAGDNRRTGPDGNGIIFEDRNKLQGWNGCTSLTTDGFSEAWRGSAQGVSLTDTFRYTVASVNGFGVSLPPGAGFSGSAGSATVSWSTPWDGNRQNLRHDYDSQHGVTNVVAHPGVGIFMGFSHTVSAEYRNGANVYRVSKNRNEPVC
jgi:hypothetical protein